jgi:hypothetical protein
MVYEFLLCPGDWCPFKSECFRFLCEPSPYRRHYFGEIPYDLEKHDCQYLSYLRDHKPVEKDDLVPLMEIPPTVCEFKPSMLPEDQPGCKA